MQVDSLIAVYKQSGKETIPEAYSRVLRDQLTLRGQLTESLAKQYGSSPYTAMRAASTSLIDQLTKLPSEVPLENPDIAKLVDSDIDTVLEVHGTSDLVRGYADAVKHVPYAGDAAEVKNVELLDDAFAMKIAELKTAMLSLEKHIQKAKAQYDESSAEAVNLMYVAADDLYQAYPEFDAQLNEEIKQNEWGKWLESDL